MQIGSKKVLLTVAFAVGLAGFGPTRAHACECGAPPPPLERVAAMAAVFEGYVLDTALAPEGGALIIHYQVLRAWKGVHADTVVTVTTGTDGAACGIPAELHTAYLVYAGMFQGQLTAGSCFLSHWSDQDTGDFAAIGAPMEVGLAAPGSLGASAAPGSSSENASSGCAIVGTRPSAPSNGWFVGLATLGLAYFAASASRRMDLRRPLLAREQRRQLAEHLDVTTERRNRDPAEGACGSRPAGARAI